MLILLIALNSTVTGRFSTIVVERSLIFCLSGLFTTHLLRNFIRRHHFLTLPFAPILPRLLLLTVTAAIFAGLLQIAGFTFLATITTFPKWLMSRNIFAGTFEFLLLFIPWTTIYCLYFYIQQRQQRAIEKKRLELLLKEKELCAAGPVVDIDFIISSLDRIRHQIDKDPGTARAGITAFSQLLRKGHLKTD